MSESDQVDETSELEVLLASCTTLENQYHDAIHCFSSGETRQWKEMQLYIAREAVGLSVEGCLFELHKMDPTLDLHSANVTKRTDGSSGGKVHLKLYSHSRGKYESLTVPYCDREGFSYGVWSDRLRDLEQWFDDHDQSSPDSLESTDRPGADEELSFWFTLRPYNMPPNHRNPNNDDGAEATAPHDTLRRFQFS